MSDKLTTQEENGEKVFTVELEPGSEVTMQTADTYVDKNIRVKAKNVDPITYTGGTGIDVDNDNYTISVDDTVVTVSKLASGELQAIDLDPTSSHVISQAFTATESYLGPTYLLYTFNKETGQLDPNPHGGLFYETEGLDNSVVAVMNQDEDGQIALSSHAERPIYYNTNSQTFTYIALTTDFTGTAENGVWKSITIGDTTATFSTEKNLTRAEIITALGYTPYDSTNPSNYITSAGVSYTTVTGALGFVPYSATNPEGYISGITNDMVVNALGYSPYDSSNPNGYITGISKNDVTTALGYTPYSSANPNGFITRTVSNLENYFDKTTISEMIGQGLQTKIVATLPTSDIKTNIIYMVPLTGTEGYTQWMFIDGNWEKLGTTNINLTEYAKTADLSDVAKTGSYTSLLDKPDIPTDLGDLTNTAGYIKNDVSNLTNYTKTTDLATVARTGSYADLSGRPTIPTSVGSLTNDAGYLTAGDLTSIGVSTLPNDANYAKMSDITALQELDVDQIKEAIAITQNVGTIKGVTAGTGLSGGGETGKVTLNHSNSVTAKTTYGSNETSVVSGGSFIVTDVKYDSEGHITASQDRQITIPVIPDITGMLTENNYADTLDSVYQEKGNYQPAGTYLTPVNVVNDNTGNYVVNVTQTTNGQITVTKGNLPTLSVIEGSTTTPTTDSVTVLKSVAGSGHAITETFVNVPTQKYIDDLVGDINAVLDAINGEVI